MANAQKSKEGLGKGIKALLNNIDNDIYKKPSSPTSNHTLLGDRINILDIEPNPNQPRKDFDEESLNELAESIKIHDIIQPITVVKVASGKYQIISGERRWRASKIAGLKDIPVFIRNANDQQKIEWGLIENLQREDLNSIEIALGYQNLMNECNLTQEQVGDRMHKDRSTITNYLRLLKLPANIQIAIRNNDISMGHARVLSGIQYIDHQLFVFDEILKKSLSVRQTEELAKSLKELKPSTNPKVTQKIDPELKEFHKKLEDFFETRITVKTKAKHKGSITINFDNKEDLDRIMYKVNS